MKNIKVLIMVVVFLLLNELLFAQANYLNISFSSNYYKQHTTLDSITIRNLSRSCDTTLYSPDTVLTINVTVGLNNKLESSFFLSQNYPNPVVDGNTLFDVLAPNGGKIILQLIDLNSKVLAEYDKSLAHGRNTFYLYNLKSGMYILKAKVKDRVLTKKIISTSARNGLSEKIVFIATDNHIKSFKSIVLNRGFCFEPGDTLRYIGYSVTPNLIIGSDVLESIPTSDTIITFDLLEGMPCPEVEAVKYAGHLYPTVQIGDQCWLKENLNVGIRINSDSNMLDNGIIEKYCYDNIESNCDIYGGLYQWDEMMQYTIVEGAQGICPVGWHPASLTEWETLIDGHNGNDLKETGTKHWVTGNNATNSTGFTGLPAGYKECCGSGVFDQIGTLAAFFTTTKLEPPYFGVWKKSFFYNGGMIGGGNVWESHGNSFRCIKD